MSKRTSDMAVLFVIGLTTMLLSFAIESVGVPGWLVPAGCLVLLFVGTPETGKKVNSLLSRLSKRLGV